MKLKPLPAEPCAPPPSAGDPLEQVLAYIERRLFEPLSVALLADVAGLSPFHFSRHFTARIGESVMAYVRRRRMLRAAARLGCNPGVDDDFEAPALIDLALDCGFESQEAFTRAFAQVFGVTPGRYKRDPVRYQAAAMEKAMNQIPAVKPNVTRLEGVTRKAAFVVAGFSERIAKDNMAAIPAIWPKLRALMPFDGQTSPVCYGLCYGSNEEEGSFSYMAAAEIAPGKKPPAALTLMQVPAQTYVVFRITLAAGEIHPQMRAAMKYIFTEGLPNCGRKPSGGIDLEVYGEQFNPEKAGSVLDFYIPVEP
ncbi:helix-turn-helix domain-containing protein [Dongia sp.]|uniref:helix-turn-helix domain-containing protein n=1 Tax=Dongia sp. TaxID=1977262 RepID=UPI003751D483